MRKSFIAIAITLLTSTQLFAGGIAKNIDEYAGTRCNTPQRGSGIIAGYFSGMTDNPIVSSDGYVPVDRYRCFKTMNECRGWLYTMESLYGSPTPRAKMCTKF